MTATLETSPPDQLDFRELDDQDAEVLPSRETLCGWHCYPCHPVYYCYPVYYCAPSWCYG
jgi:hypothetical protein